MLIPVLFYADCTFLFAKDNNVICQCLKEQERDDLQRERDEKRQALEQLQSVMLAWRVRAEEEVYTHTHSLSLLHTHTHTHTHTHMHMYVCTYIYVYMYMYMYMHIYIHTHTHTGGACR